MHYLKRACTNNLHSLSRVTPLIDAFDRATDFVSDQPPDVQAGASQIGPYRPLQELLSGSFRELSTDTSPEVCEKEKARERFVLYVVKNFLASQPAAPCCRKNSTGA